MQNDYGYLNEHSHPNGACLIPYRNLTGSQLSFRESPANHTIKGVAHAAATDWLLTIYSLLEVTAARRQVTEILKDLANQHLAAEKNSDQLTLLKQGAFPLIAKPTIQRSLQHSVIIRFHPFFIRSLPDLRKNLNQLEILQTADIKSL